MSQEFVNTIDSNPIYASRAESDVAGTPLESYLNPSNMTAAQRSDLGSALDVDETVLYNDSTDKDTWESIELSEVPTHFEYVDIYYRTSYRNGYSPGYVRLNPSITQYTVLELWGIGLGSIAVANVCIYFTVVRGINTDTWSRGAGGYRSMAYNTVSSSTSVFITRVVGVNRIAGAT